MKHRLPLAGSLLALFLVLAAAGARGRARASGSPIPRSRRARGRSASELRCLVCQNESIDNSDADLAHDLRVLLRERIAAGDSDQQAIQYIVDRYGHFVLLKPPVEPATYALWFGPPGLLLLARRSARMLYLRRRRPARPRRSP